MEAKDFSYTADRFGYMLYYKGKSIGGAGVIGRPRMHWRHARKNCADNAASALREIDGLLKGFGRVDMLKAIHGN